jgi:hypothetical protein
MDRCLACHRRPDVSHHLHHGYCVICWHRIKRDRFAAFTRKG